MGGIFLIFIPVHLLVRHLLGPPGLSRPITSTSWTASSCPPPLTLPLTHEIHNITVAMKKVA